MKFPFFSSLKWCGALVAAAALAACDGATDVDKAAGSSAAEQASPTQQTIEPVAMQPAATPQLLAHNMERSVGDYPNAGTTGYLETGALAERIKQLLGNENYAIFIQNMGVATPLTKDGQQFYVSGNLVDQGGREMAALVVDPAQNALRIWLVHAGTAQVFQSPEQAQMTWPQDIQTMMENYQAAAKAQ